MDKDLLQRFVFDDFPVRGGMVHLNAAWEAILERRAYPEPIRGLLGQLLAAAALLASTIKYRGSLTLQVQGSGPITLMVVEYTHEHTLRGIAHWQEVTQGSFKELVGDGKFVITIDQSESAHRYQSIVPLSGDTVAEMLQNYLTQSEQLATTLWLAADGACAGGVLLQKMPGDSPDPDAWDRVTRLAQTLTETELLTLPNADLLYRLYHEENLRLFELQPISFRCNCTRERVRNMLRALGIADVDEVLEKEGAVTVHCEFCNQRYDFDRVDVEQLFAAEVSPVVPRTRH